jgi:hypothetical protein
MKTVIHALAAAALLCAGAAHARQAAEPSPAAEPTPAAEPAPAAAMAAEAPPMTEAPAPAASTAGAVAFTERKRADFVAMTPGKAAFAVLGAVAMISEGNRVVTENNVDDPAWALSKGVAAAIAEKRGLRVAETPLKVAKTKPADLAAAAGGADVVVDVQTLAWSYVYAPTDWTHFSVGYRARLQVVDAKTKAVLLKGDCLWGTPKGEGVAQSVLLDNGAAGLKERLATATSVCMDQFTAAAAKL